PINVGHTATNYGGTAISIALSDGYLYVANGADGLRIFSVTGLNLPKLSISQTPTNALVFSWPAPTRAFSFHPRSGITSGSRSALTNKPKTINATNQILAPRPANATFYRLIQTD